VTVLQSIVVAFALSEILAVCALAVIGSPRVHQVFLVGLFGLLLVFVQIAYRVS
jgi:hypothetical protein